VAAVGAADCGDVRRVARGGKPVVHSGANGASPDGRFSRSLMAGDEEDDAIAMSDRAVQLAVDRTPCAVEGHSMQIDDAIGLDIAAAEALVPASVQGRTNALPSRSASGRRGGIGPHDDRLFGS